MSFKITDFKKTTRTAGGERVLYPYQIRAPTPGALKLWPRRWASRLRRCYGAPACRRRPHCGRGSTAWPTAAMVE
jgi:hypothetical protein